MNARESSRLTAAVVLLFAVGSCNDVSEPALSQLSAVASVRCDGALEGGTFGNVEVRRGGICALIAVEVRGNVKVLEGASLELLDAAVKGNVEGDKAFSVDVEDSWIGGNVQIQDGARATVLNSTVVGDIQIKKIRNLDEDGVILVIGNEVRGGNIQVEDNLVATLDVSLNEIFKGNLQVFKNAGGGDKVVADNTVAQNLQCKENAPPFTASANAAGDREGQCK